jgi:prevent-host-death family protein
MRIGVKKAKDQLSQLLLRAAAGDEITITKRGVPIARMIAAEPEPRPRKLGIDSRKLVLYGGKVWIAADFDAPMMLVEDPKYKRKKRELTFN